MSSLYKGTTGNATQRSGGLGVFSILPPLGMAAGLKSRRKTYFGPGKLGLLAGISPHTASKALSALRENGLITSSYARRFGKTVVCHSVSEELSGASTLGDGWSRYFYFSMRTVFGGNWATLTKAQHALYIGAATCAVTCTEPPDENPLLREVLLPGQRLRDISASYGYVWDLRYTNRTRFACVSHEALSSITGVHPDTLQRAAADLRWSEHLSAHAPLAVYPTRTGQSLLYHFRDHCSPLF